eukprot:Nk52_evm56s2309 gene=Nk52_evmTU56s2309
MTEEERTGSGRRRSRASEEAPKDGVDVAFTLMEDLIDKLKLLNYEKICYEKDIRPLNMHYFALQLVPAEQFWCFSVIAAWLLQKAKYKIEFPQQFDDPNATVTNIISGLKKLQMSTDFPPAKLKQGYGETVCQVLSLLADHCLKLSKFSWKTPIIPAEDYKEEAEVDDDAEVTADSYIKEVEVSDAEDEEELYMDIGFAGKDNNAKSLLSGIGGLGAGGSNSQVNSLENISDQEKVLSSKVDSASWKLELERVQPLLKITATQSDTKDWRTHLQQMQQHDENIKLNLSQTHGHLDKLAKEMTSNLEKISSREKYVNSQLDSIIQEYRHQQDKLAEVREKYNGASGTVTEYTNELARITEELDSIKAQMDERGTSMTDASPLVKIKQALNRIKLEITQMNLRIGVVEHTLLTAKLNNKNIMQNDMNTALDVSVGIY